MELFMYLQYMPFSKECIVAIIKGIKALKRISEDLHSKVEEITPEACIA